MTGNLSFDLEAITKTPAFLESDKDVQQEMLRVVRDNYVKQNPKELEFANSVAEDTNKRFLRATGEGRHIPNNLQIEAPWQSQDFGYLSEDERLAEIEKFKLKIPEIAAQDTLNKEDNEFYLNQVAEAQIRATKGENTGYVADKAYRTWDGFAAGLASYVGATDIADKIRASTSENPKYDEDFMATLFQGAGDMAASTTIFLAAALGGTAATGNPAAGVYAGTAATLGTNAISRYNEAYRQAIEKGLNDNQAHEAGVYSLPGAAIDSIGDKLIANKFLPKNLESVFKGTDQIKKRQLFSELVADKSKRGVMMGIARDAFVEGSSEAIGDYTAGYGAFLATGETDFIPKSEELAKSFAVGAILGGAVSTAVGSPTLLGAEDNTLANTGENLDKIQDKEQAQQVYDLVAQGKYKEAFEASKVALKEATDTAKTQTNTPVEQLATVSDVAQGKPGAQQNTGININSEPDNTPIAEVKEAELSPQTFLASNDQEDAKQAEAIKALTQPDPKKSPKERQEDAAVAVLEKTEPTAKQNFYDIVKEQAGALIGAYGSVPILKSLGRLVAETTAPIRGIRAGVINRNPLNEYIESPAADFVREEGERVNNIKLIDANDPKAPIQKGLADFSVLNRGEENSAPIGKYNVAATENLNTKIQEAVAMGRPEGIVAIAPVNSRDLSFLQDNNIPFLNTGGIKGVGVQQYEGSNENLYLATSEKALKEIAKQLDSTYGPGKWIIKDSTGFGGYSNFQNEQALLAAFKEQKGEIGGLALNGLYAEFRNEGIADGNKKSEYRVHAVKRNGKIEIIPYGTHNRNSTVPILVRTEGIRDLENAALKALNKANDSIADNEFFGVDVVINADLEPVVVELNPTNFGDIASEYGVASGQSGYIDNDFVQSAVYAHLKGRVPAFVLAARKIIREQIQESLIAEGSPKISNNIALMFNSASDQVTFAQEIVRNYGERFRDYTEEIWNAFTESAGQVTQKIMDLIQRIIDTIRFKPVDSKVSKVNQPLMDQVKSNTQQLTTIARGKATVNQKSEQKESKPSVYDSGSSKYYDLDGVIKNPLENHPDLSYSIGAGVNDGSIEYSVLHDSQRMQRGYPEIYATIQSALPNELKPVGDYATGVRTSIYEHIGDLAHRAGSSHIGAMRSKIERHALSFGGSALTSRLDSEIETQDKSNAAFQIAIRAEKAGGKYDIRAAMASPEFDSEYKKAKQNNLLLDATFAAMYSRLQSFTPIQAAGRNMAIAFGMQRYSSYYNLAAKIKEFFDAVDEAGISPDDYYKFGFDINGVNNLSRTNNNLEFQWEANKRAMSAHLQSGESSTIPQRVRSQLIDEISHDDLLAPIDLIDGLINQIKNPRVQDITTQDNNLISQLRNYASNNPSQKINFNYASDLVDFVSGTPIYDLVKSNEKVQKYLSEVPVIRGSISYFDGKVISLRSSRKDLERSAAHELTHAVLEYSLANDPEFAKEIKKIQDDSFNEFENKETIGKIIQTAFTLYNSFGKNQNVSFSQYFADQVNFIKKSVNINGLIASDSDMFDAYAFTGQSEFLAAVMSDARFNERLRKEPKAKEKSFIQKIIDSIAKLFGRLNESKEPTKLEKIEKFLKEYVGSDNFDVKQYQFATGRNYDLKVKNQRQIQIKQLKELKAHKIDDSFDSNTNSLLIAVKQLKPSRINNLPPIDRDRVWQLVSNIYNARSKKVRDPEARIDTKKLLSELESFQGIIDSIYIEHKIKELDGLYDLSDVDFNGDVKAFEEYVNELQKKDEDFQLLKNSINAKRRATYTRKMESWRKQFGTVRNQILAAYPTAEDYLQAYEENEGGKVPGESLRNFMKMHYDYLTSIADVSAMEGGEMYRHFFAINNLLDQSFMYGGETTAKYIANLRDSQVDVASLERKFRDPVINQGRGFFGGIDAAARSTEIAQTQLNRWTPFIEGKEFLQNDLMGPLLQSIMIESQNDEARNLREYEALKKEFEEKVGREMNGEDRIALAITSRLIQFEYGKDGNKEFLVNIDNEVQNIVNIVGDEANNIRGAGTAAQQRDYRKSIIPVFEQLVNGLKESPNPMEQFVININSRLGLGDQAVGEARAKLLNGLQSIMEQYTLSNKVVSELFYKKPFRSYVNYLPRYVIPINPEQFQGEGDIADEISKFDDLEWQTNSMTAEPGQVKDRRGIGKKGHYTNNIEFIFSRGIHVNSLTASTTAERFILNARLKGETMRNLINGSNSTYAVDQLQHWARTVMAHAMHSGNPLGTVGIALKHLNENFARVALSGLHQGLTQTISGYTDYQIRTGNIKGAMQSASFYIQNKEAMDKFFMENAAWIDKRSFLGEQEMDRRRNPIFDEGSILSSPFVKKLSKIHDKAGEIITYSLRKGDDFTARSLVLAEYARLLGQKNPLVKSINDVDFSVVEGKALSQAILNVEQNINASNKATRGEFFVDRKRLVSTLRNVTVAFSSHVLMLAGQFNIAARDLYDLHQQGGSGADKMRAIRTMGAILAQTFAFSSARYVINGAMAMGMISLMRDLFDDEEGKIAELEMKVRYAKDIGNDVMQEAYEYELKNAKQIAKQLDTFSQRQLSFGSYWKNAVKDELGAVHFLFNGPGIPQRLVFPTFDAFGEMLMKEDKEARVENLQRRIKILKESGKYGQAARLTEELNIAENQEYMPWHVARFDSAGLGGVTGTALEAIYASVREFNDAAFGIGEININDFIMSAQSMGIGQADLNRWFKTIDRIEDEQFKIAKDREDRQKKRREEIARERLEREKTLEEDRVLQQILNE